VNSGGGNFYFGQQEPGQDDDGQHQLKGETDMGDQDDFPEIGNVELFTESQPEQAKEGSCQYGEAKKRQ